MATVGNLFEENYETLLESSRTPEGRAHLATTDVLPSLIRCLPSSSPSLLLLLLRLIRNLCAGDATFQNSFIDLNGPETILNSIYNERSRLTLQIEKVALQVLGNVAMAGEKQKEAVWKVMFPNWFMQMAHVRDAGVCGVLCMVIDTCCSGGEQGKARLEEICGGLSGIDIVKEIFVTASTVGYQEEWFEWLISKACIQKSHFMDLFLELGYLHDSDSDGPLTKYQAFFLGILSKCLSERPKEVTISSNFVIEVFDILKDATAAVDFSCKLQRALPTGLPQVDVLGYALTIIKEICAWECCDDLEVSIDYMLRGGIVELLLGFLRDLGPPAIVRKSILQGKNKESLPEVPDPVKLCPYRGFRRDVAAVLGNCTHRRKHVQDEIRKCDGILLLLQQCIVDEDNPYLREWGIMAVRNLLEGNEENQKEVAELRLQGAVDTPNVSNLGLRVEMDENSGHPKLVNMS